ncbi:MAG: hypothetical protein E7453_01370 [Ruminococcaceae bacterium]|nr:hypothetical protein [Oscillospiraceae bacterium]
MIGSGLKKFAQANGLSVDGGIGYGVLRGFQATLSEGSGYKQIVVKTKFPDVEKLNALQGKLNSVNLQKDYRVQQLSFATDGVAIVFLDNPGTMAKIEAFTDWFFPLLTEAEAYGAHICPECGEVIDGNGVWRMVSGVAGFYHTACAEKLSRELNAENEAREQADTGTYANGVVGAAIGALLGAVVWALVLSAGYVMSIIGLLIAFLADKGYDLLKGRQGKGKIVTLIVSVVLGVAIGTVLSVVFAIIGEMMQGNLPGFTYADIPFFFSALLADQEFVVSLLISFGQGLLFAAIGVVFFITQAAKKVTAPKMKELK